ncbi:MAG: transposase [Polaribacter sp.]
MYKHAVVVSVVNLLRVKRFIAMKLAKVKTDKSETKTICKYAQINKAPRYKALIDVQNEYLEQFQLLEVN